MHSKLPLLRWRMRTPWASTASLQLLFVITLKCPLHIEKYFCPISLSKVGNDCVFLKQESVFLCGVRNSPKYESERSTFQCFPRHFSRSCHLLLPIGFRMWGISSSLLHLPLWFDFWKCGAWSTWIQVSWDARQKCRLQVSFQTYWIWGGGSFGTFHK